MNRMVFWIHHADTVRRTSAFVRSDGLGKGERSGRF